jgi:hypothetical protein
LKSGELRLGIEPVEIRDAAALTTIGKSVITSRQFNSSLANVALRDGRLSFGGWPSPISARAIGSGSIDFA